jgi:hypothetical protein
MSRERSLHPTAFLATNAIECPATTNFLEADSGAFGGGKGISSKPLARQALRTSVNSAGETLGYARRAI